MNICFILLSPILGGIYKVDVILHFVLLSRFWFPPFLAISQCGASICFCSHTGSAIHNAQLRYQRPCATPLTTAFDLWAGLPVTQASNPFALSDCCQTLADAFECRSIPISRSFSFQGHAACFHLRHSSTFPPFPFCYCVWPSSQQWAVFHIKIMLCTPPVKPFHPQPFFPYFQTQIARYHLP